MIKKISLLSAFLFCSVCFADEYKYFSDTSKLSESDKAKIFDIVANGKNSRILSVTNTGYIYTEIQKTDENKTDLNKLESEGKLVIHKIQKNGLVVKQEDKNTLPKDFYKVKSST